MWYFRSLRHEGQTGPFDGLQAANFVRSNPDAFCWRPGFIQWLPVRAVGAFGGTQADIGNAAADKIDFKIFGDDAQYVEIELDPGETAITNAANLIYMGADVAPGTERGRLAGFTHKGNGKAKVALSAQTAGAIAPVNLAEFGSVLVSTYTNFVGAARGVKVVPCNVAGLEKGPAGEVFCRLEGDGWAFIHVAGTAVDRTLAKGEVLKVNAAAVAAMTDETGAVAETFGTTTILTLTGPGRVWLESLSGAPRA